MVFINSIRKIYVVKYQRTNIQITDPKMNKFIEVQWFRIIKKIIIMYIEICTCSSSHQKSKSQDSIKK